MSTRNTLLSVIQKEGKKGSAMNSVFDNENEVAAKIEKNEKQQNKNKK